MLVDPQEQLNNDVPPADTVQVRGSMAEEEADIQ